MKRTTSSKPPENDDDWRLIWDAVEKINRIYPVASVASAIFGNWKAIAIGLAVGLALGGNEVLQAWGIIE